MTIYILDLDQKLCATYLDDKSLDKMIEDIANVLMIVHNRRKYISAGISKWSKWTLERHDNYLWLINFGKIIRREITFRAKSQKYNILKIGRFFIWAENNIPDLTGDFKKEFNTITKLEITPFPLVMPKKYIIDENELNYTNIQVVSSYRNYYQEKLKQRFSNKHPCDKTNIFWTFRQKPDWITSEDD